MKRKKLIIILVLFLLTITVLFLFSQNKPTNTMSYNEFLIKTQNNLVEKVTIIDENILNIKLANDSKIYLVPNPQTKDFKEFLLINNIKVENGTNISDSFIQFFSIIIIIGIVIIYLRKKDSKDKQLIINANKDNNLSTNGINFDDVAGNEEAKESIKDIIEFIKNPEKYSKVGARMPRGILFYGSPGTGKTLMAKAVAGEANVPFYAMSGSDFIQMYVGVGASRIRNLFKTAKKDKKAVIFIDEIDAIGKKRGNDTSGSNGERDQTLNALLTEMSGFNNNEGIIVIAATNRIDTLDNALLRPGRFDRHIEIGLPDVNARKRILKLHSNNKLISDNINFDSLAKETVMFSGAMLENLMNEAAILTANKDETSITKEIMEKAFYTVIAGAEKKDRSNISLLDRKITAYHEAGHALMTKLLLPENLVAKVTIIPSTKGAGGFSMNIPKEKMYKTKKEIESDIKIMLAGRIAEELIFGNENITTGASNDIEKTTMLVKDYTVKYGMNEEVGLLNLDVIGLKDESLIKIFKDVIKKEYLEAKRLLEKNINKLHTITNLLLEKETIDDDDLTTILLD